ncbi:MAG TPA: GNAT family N-acetyltransferase [Candidatus Saccharimonadales bacterium]|nr:GNAT family N-acetyltransferase [Candidatus Saccharimonadales bacterium]
MAGLRFRHFHAPDDYAGMAAANQATRDAAGMEEVITAEGMARDYGHFINWDPFHDTVVAERDGRIVGYARTQWRDQTDGERAFTTVVVVEPGQTGIGITEALLAWAEDRLVAIARAIPTAERRPGSMRTFSFGSEADYAALLETRGWARTGQGHEMVRPDLDDIPDVPLPAGLVVRPIGLDTASRRAVWDAAVEAFADERNEEEASEEDWASFLSDPRQDPALWVIAFDGDDIAGGVQGKIDPEENAHHGRERGLLDGVWTRRAWRRRGLARALIARSLVRLRDHGMTSAYLGVDGLNPNQAMTLYESVGFGIVSTAYDWTKPLPADAGPMEVPT